MEPRVSLITIGVADLDRSRDFYEALGWVGQQVQETVFVQAGGLGLVLWGRGDLTADAGIADDHPHDGYGGVALAHNVRDRSEVDEIVATARAAGAEITREPEETFYGGYAAYFRDPDGHVWEVAHNPGFTIEPDGSLTLPDFGAA
jgi:catechol 2,3-dioxygenase-like lactoylglutathione lyase family enzyme